MAKRVLVITGNKSLTRMLNALGSPKARELHRKAVRKAARPILEHAKAESPVKSGAMRKSLTIKALRRSRRGIGVRVTQKEGLFKGDQFYGGFQEFGWLTGRRRKKEHRKSNRERRKIPGKWFMRGAGTAKEQEAIDIYESELGTMIQQEARK